MKILLPISLFVLIFSGVVHSEGCPTADLSGDCRVGLEDLAITASQWLEDRSSHFITTWNTDLGDGTTVNLGLNFVLVPRYGFVVAGITTLIGYLVLLILQIYRSRPYLTWNFPWRSLRNTVIASVFMSLIALYIYSLSGDIKGLQWGYLFFSIAVAILVYLVSLLLLGEASKDEKSAIRHFFNR